MNSPTKPQQPQDRKTAAGSAFAVQPRETKVLRSSPSMLPHHVKRSEAVITQQIRHYLRMKGIFHYKAWQGLGSTKGVPDIVGVLKGGRALFIEVKTDRGKLSEHQKAFLDNAQALGAKAFVARSVDDLIKECL